MYPGTYAQTTPDKPAYVMASTGEIVTYRELDERSNRLAHLFRARGLKPRDHIAIVMENHARFLEIAWAAVRAGLVYTPVNWHLTPDEARYVIDDCGARLVFTSTEHVASVPADREVLVVDDTYEPAVAEFPTTPVDDELLGGDMIYTSGTTGRPKGGVRPRSDVHPRDTPEASMAFFRLFGFDADTIYLSPGAPLYHAAPLRFSMGTMTLGGTAVVLDRFDPVEPLRAIERWRATHSQWVPTMFVRMLRVPEEERAAFDLSSHRVAIHAAAPCPPAVKHRMIDWWGPIVWEYFGASEGGAITAIAPEEWLQHPGSVGKAVIGTIVITDDEGNELPAGEAGIIRSEGGVPIKYHNDEEKTAKSLDRKGRPTVGDMGYLDDEGYLYLTDRKDFMIISGGVNIYPQEIEDVLIQHPAVLDVAVFGVPNAEFGEEVKAVVQPAGTGDGSDALAAELTTFCREHLAGYKVPRTIDFMDELPRSDAGKLYKRRLRDQYWGEGVVKI